MNCNEANPLLDAYVDSQLDGERLAAVSAHVGDCQDCSRQAHTIRRLKQRVGAAVSAEPVPLGLETRLRARLRDRPAESPWFRFSFVTAALGVAILTMAGWALAWQPMQRQVLAVLGVGADDHIHCTLERKKPEFGKLHRPIDPEYRDLLSRVTASMPAGYELRESHFCRSSGKRFQHMVFERDGQRVSVIVTPKAAAGSFPAMGALAAKMRADGIPLYEANVRGVSTAGFESGQNVAFVVSGLDGETNLRLLAAVAGRVRGVM